MGAISSSISLPILKEFLTDSNQSVRETCEIAISKIEWDNSSEGQAHKKGSDSSIPHVLNFLVSSFFQKSSNTKTWNRLYTSIDPAPATSSLLSGAPKPDSISSNQITALQKDLTDTKLPLFERYRAMFALRNIGTPAAVDALASGFSDDSALFK